MSDRTIKQILHTADGITDKAMPTDAEREHQAELAAVVRKALEIEPYCEWSYGGGTSYVGTPSDGAIHCDTCKRCRLRAMLTSPMQSALAEFEAKVRAERDKDWSFALFGDPEFVTTPEDADEKWARSNSLYVELEEADAALAEVQKCWDIDKRDIAVLREQIAALQGAVRWALSELDTPDERLHALNTNPTWSVSGIERKSKAYREAYAAATTLHWRTEELTTWREREAKP